ncbi:hypothetical protein ID866_7671 [Astraeus odoratus]|nr:hypothetical protein ID866_7671 [Astraeus odoratus]
MGHLSSSFAVLLLALFTTWLLHLRPYLAAIGIPGRSVESVGNGNCKTVPELQACESKSTAATYPALPPSDARAEVVLHQPSGLVYLACSTPADRMQWMPAVNKLNTSRMFEADYVATYDPRTSAIKRLTFTGLASRGGIALHGMDVVPSLHDPSHLYVYVVNHRRPLAGDPWKVGADSVIEVFETRLSDSELRHVRTFEDPTVIITPNDVVGSPDGQSVYFTNDNAQKLGLKRHLNVLLQPYDTSVGFCDADQGCKFAYRGLHASNGIVKGLGHDNDTYYVADYMLGEITVLERKPDNTFMYVEAIKTGYAADNLAIDSNGALWVAGITDLLGLVFRKFENPSELVPSTALRVTVNNDSTSFYGEKYSVDKIFEDPGQLASGITSVVYDTQGGLLFMHGAISTHFTICEL